MVIIGIISSLLVIEKAHELTNPPVPIMGILRKELLMQAGCVALQLEKFKLVSLSHEYITDILIFASIRGGSG